MRTEHWPASTPLKPIRMVKTRLPCGHPGCNLTFPRSYELRRHQDNVHQRKDIYLCPVYDCKRAHNSLPRGDKLREHYRKKHTNADQFICFFKDCREGPFTKDELRNHLEEEQRKGTHKEPYLDSILNALKVFGWLQTPVGYGNYHINDSDECPLQFLGCGYRGNHTPRKWGAHLDTHDMLDRSKGYLVIKSLLGG